MLIEYVVFGALVVMVLVATFVGVRRRHADRLSGEPVGNFPYIGNVSASTEGTHHVGHTGLDGRAVTRHRLPLRGSLRLQFGVEPSIVARPAQAIEYEHRKCL
jgi:hypothetical protein